MMLLVIGAGSADNATTSLWLTLLCTVACECELVHEGPFGSIPNTPVNSGDNHKAGLPVHWPSDGPLEWLKRCGIAIRHGKFFA